MTASAGTNWRGSSSSSLRRSPIGSGWRCTGRRSRTSCPSSPGGAALEPPPSSTKSRPTASSWPSGATSSRHGLSVRPPQAEPRKVFHYHKWYGKSLCLVRAVGVRPSVVGRGLLSLPRHNRQDESRWMLSIVEDRLHRRQHLRVRAELVTGVEVAIEAREVAAGHLQTDAVPLAKEIAGRPEVDLVFVDLTGRDRSGSVGSLAVAGA